MNQFSKESAANQLEFAVNLYYLAIEKLREVGEQFPELHHLIDRYIDSIHEGEPLLESITEVTDFLRHGIDDNEHFAEEQLLGWRKSQETPENN